MLLLSLVVVVVEALALLELEVATGSDNCGFKGIFITTSIQTNNKTTLESSSWVRFRQTNKQQQHSHALHLASPACLKIAFRRQLLWFCVTLCIKYFLAY
jgi:hypothetical protein